MAYHDYKTCTKCGKKDNDWRLAHCGNCLAELPPTELKVEVKGKKRDNPLPRRVLLIIWALIFFATALLGDPNKGPGGSRNKKEAQTDTLAKGSPSESSGKKTDRHKDDPMRPRLERRPDGHIVHVPYWVEREIFDFDSVPPDAQPGPFEMTSVEQEEVVVVEPRRRAGIFSFRPGYKGGNRGPSSFSQRRTLWKATSPPAPPPADPNAPRPPAGFNRFPFQTSP